MAVDIEIDGGFHRTEFDKYMSTSPTLGYLEIVDIAACGIVFCGGVRWVGCKLIVDVGVDWDTEGLAITVELYFNVPGHVYVIPLVNIVSGLIKSSRARFGILGYFDFPRPVEAAVIGGGLILEVGNIFLVSVGNHIHMR